MSVSSATKRSLSTSSSDWEIVRPYSKKQRLPKTCEWIKREAVYKDWVDGTVSPPILWIHGPPGCGKTILSEYIVGELRGSEEKPVVVGVFCDPLSLTSSAVDRIYDGFLDHPMDGDVRGMIGEEPGSMVRGSDRLFVLWDKILMLMKEGLRTTVVIDGLDDLSEMDQGFNLAARVKDLVLQNPSKTRLLISSRSDSFVQDRFGDCANISITPEKVDDDLEQFIKSELDGCPKLATYSEDLVATIKKESDGSFLWAKICIDDLDETSAQGQQPNLGNFPSSLNDTYAKCLENMTKDLKPHEIGLRNTALRWLIAPVRPLTLDELANVFMIEENILFDAGSAGRKTREFCGPLARLNGNMIMPSHHSVKTFLQGDHPGAQQIPDISHAKANASMARVCLTYLSHPAFSRSIEKTRATFDKEFGGDYSFLEYASLYWVYHVSQAEKTSELRELIKSFFTTRNAFAWADVFLPMYLRYSVIQPPPRPTRTAHFFYLYTLKSQLVRIFDGDEKISFDEQISAFLQDSFEKALSDERSHTPVQDHWLVGRLLDLAETYGWLSVAQHNPAPLLEEALKLASDQEDYLEVSQTLADYYKREGRYEEARVVLEDLVLKVDAQLEATDKRNMFAFDSLGWVYMRLNRLDEGATCLQRALERAVMKCGSTSSYTLRSKVTLAEVLNKLGRADEAEVLCAELKTQVSEYREKGTTMPKDSISQLNTLAAVYTQQGKIDEAIETWSAVVEDRMKVFGDEHRMTLGAAMQLGIAKQSGGQVAEARELFESLLPVQIKVLGEAHPDVKDGWSRLEALRGGFVEL